MAKPLWMQVREAFERKGYFPPSPELRDELVGIATDYADQKTAAAHAEIERLKPMSIDWDGVRVIMDQDSVNWVHGDDYATIVKERDEFEAEGIELNHRLNAALNRSQAWQTRAEKAEAERDGLLEHCKLEEARGDRLKVERDEERENAITWMNAYQAVCKERDEARAMVASGQMEMRDRAAKLCAWHSETLVASIKGLPIWVDAQSALEAYGREKVREGMQRAADVCTKVLDHSLGLRIQIGADRCKTAVLAEMEKEGEE